jgi:hypothetical protein
MSGNTLQLAFHSPGPVARAFYADRSPVAAIMGPIGSAKTTTCLMKIVACAMEVPPSRIDGVRYVRAVVLRDTYRRMRRTVLESWRKRIPLTVGKFTEGGDNAPSLHALELVHPRDGGRIKLEVLFAAVGNQDVEEFCRGFEVTFAYVNEVDTLHPDLLTHLFSRTGRYPDASHVDPNALRRMVWADLNAPDTDSWFYDRFVENPPPGNRLFIQPGGMDPHAENRANLPADYYTSQLGEAAWWVRRFIHNLWGASREGKPVYPEFNDLVHVAGHELVPVRGVKLILGADAGGTPALTVRQHLRDGQQRVLDELATDPGQNTGPSRFGQAIVQLLAERYPNFGPKEIEAWCDPSAIYGDSETGEGAWADIVSDVTKIRFRPAPTNDPVKRQEAVRVPMTRLIDGQAPGLLLSPRCKTLRRAYNSGYRIRRKAGSSTEFHEGVEKNQWSHVAEADQYGALGGSGRVQLDLREAHRRGVTAVFQANTDFKIV